MVSLRPQTEQTLLLLIEKSEKLLSLSFVKHMIETGARLSVSFKAGEPLQITWEPPGDEAVDAFVLTFRFFIQNNERISLGSLEQVLKDPGISKGWRERYTRARADLNAYLDSEPEPMKISYGEHIYTRRKIMEVFVFGGLAHATIHKRALFEEWRKDSGFFTFMQYEFTHVLMAVLSAVSFFSYISAEELKLAAAEGAIDD